jgi:hypothetical protein
VVGCGLRSEKPVRATSSSQFSLEERFKTFLGQLDNAESIDDMLSEAELAFGRRADFLLDGRHIALEIKSLCLGEGAERAILKSACHVRGAPR